MEKLEVICATMKQTDFRKIKEMNLRSDVLFANQAKTNEVSSLDFDGHLARMITTDSIGVGKNRNIGMLYAKDDILLLSDEDMHYCDDYPEKILSAFADRPDADAIIFNIQNYENGCDRNPTQIKKAKRLHKWHRNPYGGPRIAVRRTSFLKHNIWFSLLFGGGTVFPTGEDSKWVSDALRNGMKIYLCPENIGFVEYAASSWYTGYNEEMYYGKGAYSKAEYHLLYRYLWWLYFSVRSRKKTELSFFERIKWLKYGADGYDKCLSYSSYTKGLNQ